MGRFGVAWRAVVCAVVVHGYFMLRLVEQRPYFISEGQYDGWYSRMFDLPPEPWRTILAVVSFEVLPWAVVAAVALWWGVRWWRRTGTKGVAWLGGTMLGCGALWLVLTHPWPAPDTTAAAPPTRGSRPNILIIGSDSLRGDRLGCAGYRPQRSDGLAAAGVSPHIDELAKQSVVFGKCMVPLASTEESITSLMSSQYPHTHGLRQMYPGRAAIERVSRVTEPLAAVLGRQGYETAAIGDWCAAVYQILPLGFNEVEVSNFDNFRIYMTQVVFVSHFVMPLYFDNEAGYKLYPEIGSFAEFVTPQVVTGRVIRRIEQGAGRQRPFFWHVFYSCNHLPYRSPGPYNGMFADPAYHGRNRTGVDFDIDAFIGGTTLEDKWRALPENECQQVRALYDGCTRMFDDCVGEIIDSLRRQGLVENTIVIVTADHGDDLYEPGATLGHGLGFNGGDQTNHIPLVMRVPGAEPREIPQLVRLIDVAPTLAELAGATAPPRWEGHSFAGWIMGTETPAWRPYYGETGYPFVQFREPGVERPKVPPMDHATFIDESFGYQFVVRPEFEEAIIAAKQRCLRTERWKLICTPGADGRRHFRLHHLPDDPHCERDVAVAHPDVVAAMSAALERWMDQHKESPITEIFPAGEPE